VVNMPALTNVEGKDLALLMKSTFDNTTAEVRIPRRTRIPLGGLFWPSHHTK
jgi:hypothetical protein